MVKEESTSCRGLNSPPGNQVETNAETQDFENTSKNQGQVTQEDYSTLSSHKNR